VKRLGPDLKMPKLKGGDLKVPPFLSDLYIDLRDRRLLPLVALLLVAIVAAPILLKDNHNAVEPVAPIHVGGGSGSSADESLTVVRAEPGLRKYKKRLAHRSPTNPFKQRFTGPVLKGSELNEQTSTTTTTETSSGSESGGSTPSNSTGGSGGSNGSEPVPGGDNSNLRFYTWTIKVQISRTETSPDGTVKMGDPVVHEHVKSLTPLPGEKTPVVTFIGVNPSTGLALFQVSKEVTALFGDGQCISGTGSCELVEIEKGFPETFEYGPGHVRYKFKVVKIELVRVAKP